MILENYIKIIIGLFRIKIFVRFLFFINVFKVSLSKAGSFGFRQLKLPSDVFLFFTSFLFFFDRKKRIVLSEHPVP